MTGRINDRQLSTLQRHASLYLGMSAHEGLSVPLIDSMALGVPSVVRSAGAVAETAGDGAIVVDPSAGPEEIARCCAQILRDENSKLKLIARGLKQASAFRRGTVLDRFRASLSVVMS
jgi:glycosyltransferase involved in cell wall biosynthesis